MFLLQIGDRPLLRGDGSNGLHAEHAQGTEEVVAFTRLYTFDAVLLDLHDIAALATIRRLRSSGYAAPILALCRLADPRIRITALDLGADDVVTMCTTDELLARLRAMVRRIGRYTASTLRVGPLELHLNIRKVRVSGQQLHLTPKEYALLELLMLKRDHAITKGTCLNHLYGTDEKPELKTLDVIVSRLRKRLAAVGLRDLVQNVWGLGWMIEERQEAALEEAH